MNVKELKNLIANLPDELEILIQKDIGNEYPFSVGDFELDSVCLPTERNGPIYSANASPIDEGIGEEEWKNMFATRPRAIVLRPKY